MVFGDDSEMVSRDGFNGNVARQIFPDSRGIVRKQRSSFGRLHKSDFAGEEFWLVGPQSSHRRVTVSLECLSTNDSGLQRIDHQPFVDIRLPSHRSAREVLKLSAHWILCEDRNMVSDRSPDELHSL